MKKFSFALLLGVLSASLVGCNNGNGKHTITFDGTNCYMKNPADDEPITDTITVDDGATANYVIYTGDEQKQYLVPNQLDITGDAKTTYNVDPLEKKANLKLESIKSDITITAIARSNELCSVTYYSDKNCTWAGHDNPASIRKNETLTAYISIYEGTFTKDNFAVLIEGTHQLLNPEMYEYGNNALTIKGEAVTNNVYIYARELPVPPPQPEKYTVDFKMTNVASTTIPQEEWQYNELGGYITAKEGYRLPTKEELAPEDVEQEPYDGKIIKYKEGVAHPLRPNQFYYESYIDSDTGLSMAYLYIYDLTELYDAKKIEIGGDAVGQVEVTFQVNKEAGGHWQNPAKTTEDRTGTIDKGATVEDALMAASGGETPVVDDEAFSFNGWHKDNDEPVYSPTPIYDDLTLHATFKLKEFNFYTDSVVGATITGLPAVVHYGEAVGGDTKPVTIIAEEGFELPEMTDVSVLMNNYEGEWLPIDFGYIRYDSNTKASFSIGEGIIKGDIKISLTAIDDVSVTFDPGDGEWPDGTDDTLIATVPNGYTYAQAFDTLGTGGLPTYSGKKCIGWKWNDTLVDFNRPIAEDGMTIVAYYEEVTVTFSNDTWENVITHAKAGDIKTYYGSTLFIGVTRTLEYTDPVTNATTTYTVRVIDEGYDYYYEDGKAIPSALTFEFVDLVNKAEYGTYQGEFGPLSTNNWENSTYRSWLNNFYTEICSQNEGFEARKAIKHTLTGKSDTPLAMKETQDYFFPMSGAEIGIADTNGQLNPTTYINQQRQNEGLSGGLTYYYYQNSAHNRIKKLDGAATEYWLRSPHVYKEEGQTDPDKPDQSNCYIMQANTGSSSDYIGGQGGTSMAENSHGYMAAFCI